MLSEEVKYESSRHTDNVSAMKSCLSKARWIQQSFEKLRQVANKCNVEFDISEWESLEICLMKNEKKKFVLTISF